MSPARAASLPVVTTLIAGMSISIDGFVADADGDFSMLYPDFDSPEWTAYLEPEVARTGAVVMGRQMFDMSPSPDDYAVDYEYQCPIFVITHTIPEHVPASNDRLTVTYVDDGIASAVAQARAAAGDKDVTCVGGPIVLDQMLTLGLVDELQVDVLPVILGSGRRFLDGVDRRMDLSLIEAQRVGPRTAMRFAVGSTNEPTA